MKRIPGFIIITAFAVLGKAQSTWDFDKAHTSVKFGVTHMMITEVDGEFKTFTGKVISKNDDFTDAQIELTIDVNSISTDNDHRDEHLKGDDFFDVARYPNITFKSVSMKKINGNKYELEGDLTLRDVTKRMKFEVVYNGSVKDAKGNSKAGFKITGTINRFDYNLKWNSMMDTGPVLGKDVTLTANVELKKQ